MGTLLTCHGYVIGREDYLLPCISAYYFVLGNELKYLVLKEGIFLLVYKGVCCKN